jgi:sugar lactone lactonase YvrE
MALRKQSSSDGRPEIERVSPVAAIPGGEFQIRGRRLQVKDRPQVALGDTVAPVVIGSESLVIARVPDGASVGELVIGNGDALSEAWTCEIGIQIADGLHPVANPAVDSKGAIYSTFSGQRGQKSAVAVYRIDLNYNVQPFVTDMMNATGLAFSREGVLYVSSRHDGIVYQVSSEGTLSVFAEGMGVATGIAFDDAGNLYVGDRSGTIFKIAPNRQIYVFATLEPSIAAYHLAFSPAGELFVAGPTTSSFDAVHRIDSHGDVTVFYRGLGRPQGIAFDAEGNLYVAASLSGRRGVVRITPDGKADLFLSGPSIVGLAFTPSKAMIVATNNALFRVDTDIRGKALP